MKKMLLLALTLVLLLSACGRTAPPSIDLPDSDAGGTAIRIMENNGTDLLLAGLDKPWDDVYSISLSALEEAGIFTEDLRPGERVNLVFDGTVEETFPAKLGNVTDMILVEDGRDLLYQLYLDVLEDLWEKDPALHDGISRIGFDLSGTRLSAAEQSAIAFLFARDHGGLEIVTGTWQELADEGIIDGEDLNWADGVHLSITEKTNEPGRVTFDAQMWRSGLGAYLFCDCASGERIGGDWEPYTIGSEAVA